MEKDNTPPLKQAVLPEQLPEVPIPGIEIPDITPVVKTREITDKKQAENAELLDNLDTKYSKI
jgi:hypothetical protein